MTQVIFVRLLSYTCKATDGHRYCSGVWFRDPFVVGETREAVVCSCLCHERKVAVEANDRKG